MMTSKPKIAILSLHPSNGGGILSSLKVVYEFASRYFEPTVFCLSFDPEISANVKDAQLFSQTRSQNYYGMNCVEIGSRWAFWEPGHYNYTMNGWEKALEGYDYFFVTAGTAIVAHPLVLLNKKYVAWIAAPHDDDRVDRIKELSMARKALEKLGHQSMLTIERSALTQCSYLLALSHYAFKRFTQIRGETANPMIICGYPMKVKNPQVSLSVRHKAGHILAVGRFDDPRKNISMLLRTFDRIYQSEPEKLLVIVGRKPAPFVLTPFASLPSYKNVLFTGYVSANELERWYQQAAVMLITSHQEGLGIVGLEALSYGVPVVSTDCGGPADFVINGKTGFLVDNNNDGAMAHAALLLLRDKELYSQCSYESLEFIRKNNDLEHINSLFTEGLCATYPELVSYFNTSQELKPYEINQ